MGTAGIRSSASVVSVLTRVAGVLCVGCAMGAAAAAEPFRLLGEFSMAFRDIAVVGTTVYATAGKTLAVWDGSDPGKLRHMGSCTLPGDAIGLKAAPPYVFVAVTDAGLAVVDVSSLAWPSVLAVCDTPGTARQVALSGGMACVADGAGGLAVVDVSVPGAPRLRGNAGGLGDAWDVAVRGGFAYVVDASSGLHIVDLSVSSAPVVVGFQSGATPAYAVAVDGDRAYFADGSVWILDVATPSAPTVLGRIVRPDNRIQDVVPLGGVVAVADGGVSLYDVSMPAVPVLLAVRDLPGYALSLAAHGAVVYAVGPSLGLAVVDAAVPSSAVVRASLGAGLHARGMDVAGSVACIADGESGLCLVDVSIPSRPRYLGAYDTPGGANDVRVVDGVAYVADLNRGLRIVSVADPSAPVEIARYNPWGYFWSVEVHPPYAYVADFNAGVHVVDVSTPSSPVQAGFLVLPSARRIRVDGRYAYVARGVSAGTGGIEVLDVANPRHPVRIGGVGGEFTEDIALGPGFGYAARLDGLWTVDLTDPRSPALRGFNPPYAGGVSLVGRNVFVAAGVNGVRVVDVSRPDAPFTAGMLAPPEADAVAVRAERERVTSAWRGFGLRTYQFEQPAYYRLSGTVRDTRGSPVADVTVVLDGVRRWTVRTSADGAYEFPDLPAGSYRLRAERPGWTFSPEIHTVVLTGDLAAVDFTAPDAGDQVQDLIVYPNPFTAGSGETVIRYTLRVADNVLVTICDLCGRAVFSRRIATGMTGANAGINELRWNGRTERGTVVDVGVFLCVVESGGMRRTVRVGVR